MNTYEKANKGLYDSTLNFDKDRRAWRADQDRLTEQFRKDLLEECGVTNNPKADKAYGIAWDLGHSYGFCEVANYFYDLVELIKD